MKGGSDISKQDLEKLVQEYFSAEGDEPGPYCKWCEEELDFKLDYSSRSQAAEVHISCGRCKYLLRWRQEDPVSEWEQLHLVYFYERYLSNQEIRCPMDDCFVIFQEYSDGPVRFRCPFCNREGLVETGKMGVRLDPQEPPFGAPS